MNVLLLNANGITPAPWQLPPSRTCYSEKLAHSSNASIVAICQSQHISFTLYVASTLYPNELSIALWRHSRLQPLQSDAYFFKVDWFHWKQIDTQGAHLNWKTSEDGIIDTFSRPSDLFLCIFFGIIHKPDLNMVHSIIFIHHSIHSIFPEKGSIILWYCYVATIFRNIHRP